MSALPNFGGVLVTTLLSLIFLVVGMVLITLATEISSSVLGPIFLKAEKV